MGTQITRKGLVFLGVLLTAGAIAQAGAPSIFVGRGNRLVRVHGGHTDTFEFDPNVHLGGMTFDSRGRLWAARADLDGDGYQSLFQIADPFGTPYLVEISDGITCPTLGSLECEWAGNTLYMLGRAGPGATVVLVTVDPNTGATTPVGATGETGIYSAGIAVDTDSMTMYAANWGNGYLCTLDWQLESHSDPVPTDVGHMGVNLYPQGLAFFEEDGHLYAIFDDFSGGSGTEFKVYTVDPCTAQATFVYDLTAYLQDAHGTGSAIAVIPEPAVLGLFGATGLLLLRRKARSQQVRS